jgi:hypothetical protein
MSRSYQISRTRTFDAAWRENGALKGASFLLTLSVAGRDPALSPPLDEALARLVEALDHCILDERIGADFSLAALADWIADHAGLEGLSAVTLARPGLQDALTLTL